MQPVGLDPVRLMAPQKTRLSVGELGVFTCAESRSWCLKDSRRIKRVSSCAVGTCLQGVAESDRNSWSTKKKLPSWACVKRMHIGMH